jgi:exosortase
VALALAARSYRGTLNENDSLAITIAGLITLIVAGFLAFWGRACARAAAFPLGFLFLAVPLPLFVLDRIIEGLRNGSAEVSYALFQVVGTPVLRQGYLFRLAHQSIEIAKECSGIRSSMALFLLVLLCGHWFLRTNIRRLILLALTVPLLIFKNAVRIVSLTLLAEYVDPSFLHGSLHRDGGVVFFAMACAIVGLMLNLLRRSEEVTASCAMASAAVAGQKV